VRVGPTLKALREKFPDQIRLAVKQHPLPFHKQAKLAARAALAAQEQGKFWEYQDRLLQPKVDLGRDHLIALAGEVGLDVARFTTAIDSEQFDKRIEAETAEAHETAYAEAHEEDYAEAPEEQYAEAHEEQPGEAPHEDDYREDEYRSEEEHGDEDVPEEPEQRSSLAQRFASRQAKRDAEKTGGGSLTSRLRGLVADAPERRG